MLVLLLLSFTPVILGRTRQGARVVALEGKPGFKSVSLAWNMEDTISGATTVWDESQNDDVCPCMWCQT